MFHVFSKRVMKRECDKIFFQYQKEWGVTPQAVRTIFLLIDMNRKYAQVSETLASMGFQVKPRKLRYFYNKIVLTDYYGAKKELGNRNYRHLVLRRA